MTPRSWLFVPGDSPSKMQKAVTTAADAVILDLEDSVAGSRKAEARRCVREFASIYAGPVELWVRINPAGSTDWERDLETAVAAGVAGVVVPKAEGGPMTNQVAGMLDALGAPPGLSLLPIATETPAALFALGAYAAAGPRLRGLTWGAEDLSAAIGAVTARTPDGLYTPLYELARSLCLAGAATAQVPAIETVYPDFSDLRGLADYAARGRRDGFVGMMAIHPAQIPVIHAAFSPTEAELKYARRVLEAFEADPDAGTLSLDGKMLDAPHLRQARRTLERGRPDRGGGEPST